MITVSGFAPSSSSPTFIRGSRLANPVRTSEKPLRPKRAALRPDDHPVVDYFGFSRKIENHAAAVALHYFACNFKIHRTLRVTPAMAAGITDRLWEVSDLITLWEAEVGKSGV